MFSVCLSELKDRNEQQAWNVILQAWPPDEIFVIGEVWYSNTMLRATSLPSIDSLPEDRPIVLLHPQSARYVQGEDPLTTFEHPEGAIYLFWPNHIHLRESDFGGRKPDYSIYIPVACTDEISGPEAAAVTFYDRTLKELQNG